MCPSSPSRGFPPDPSVHREALLSWLKGEASLELTAARIVDRLAPGRPPSALADLRADVLFWLTGPGTVEWLSGVLH